MHSTISSSLVPSPPLPLTKWPRKRWSGIFGPIPWLASTYLEYFWPIRSPLDHVLTKPRVSLVREDMEDDSQTFFYGCWICHRTGSQSWTIHNPRKNAYTLRLLPIQLHIRGSCVVFSRHVTKQRSDWPELFGMARTKESAQRYQTTFSAAILLAEVVGWERDYISSSSAASCKLNRDRSNPRKTAWR